MAEVCDLLQVPAFLARQTDLLQAAGRTGPGRQRQEGPVHGPLGHAARRHQDGRRSGNRRLLLTERGATFGYGQLVSDMRSIPWMQDLGCPVIFDATHSVQMPGGQRRPQRRRPADGALPGAGRRRPAAATASFWRRIPGRTRP